MKQKANGVNSPPVEFSIEKGVVFGVYRNDLIIDLVTAKTIVKERLKFTNSKPYPYLIDDKRSAHLFCVRRIVLIYYRVRYVIQFDFFRYGNAHFIVGRFAPVSRANVCQ